MTNATPPIKGPAIRACGRHGDYLDDGTAACPDCGAVGILVGRFCQCTGVALNGTERIAWVCDRCFGTVVRPARIGN